MFIKKAVVIYSLSFSFLLLGSYQELSDPVAFKMGELVGEITFQGWIETARRNRTAVIALMEKMPSESVMIEMSCNRSFFEGYQSYLVAKDVSEELYAVGLDKLGCALVLASYYYWTYQLTYALETNNYAFMPNELIENQAIEKAVMIAFGFPHPEITQKLKWMFKNDYLQLAKTDDKSFNF